MDLSYFIFSFILMKLTLSVSFSWIFFFFKPWSWCNIFVSVLPRCVFQFNLFECFIKIFYLFVIWSRTMNKKWKQEVNKKYIGNSKSVTILGEIMIKHLNRWELSQKKKNPGCKIYVKDFAGAKTTCMKDYMQPFLRSAPNHFILHVGTNDLYSDKTAKVLQIL